MSNNGPQTLDDLAILNWCIAHGYHPPGPREAMAWYTQNAFQDPSGQSSTRLAQASLAEMGMQPPFGMEPNVTPDIYGPLPNRYGDTSGVSVQDELSTQVKNSGSVRTLDGAGGKQVTTEILAVARDQRLLNVGVALVHISVHDVLPLRALDAEVPPNQKVVLAIKWQTGRSGGEVLVDLGTGTQFSVVGAHVVKIDAMLVPVDNSRPFKEGQIKSIEAVVQWGASAVVPAYSSSIRMPLTATTPSGYIAIPPQARRLQVVSDNITATIQAQFQPDDNGAPNTIYTTTFGPNNGSDNMTPVVAGVSGVILESSADCNALIIYELFI